MAGFWYDGKLVSKTFAIQADVAVFALHKSALVPKLAVVKLANLFRLMLPVAGAFLSV